MSSARGTLAGDGPGATKTFTVPCVALAVSGGCRDRSDDRRVDAQVAHRRAQRPLKAVDLDLVQRFSRDDRQAVDTGGSQRAKVSGLARRDARQHEVVDPAGDDQATDPVGLVVVRE
jgi:hypothetical protein